MDCIAFLKFETILITFHIPCMDNNFKQPPYFNKKMLQKNEHLTLLVGN